LDQLVLKECQVSLLIQALEESEDLKVLLVHEVVKDYEVEQAHEVA
jgi:hypothetical protein